MRTAIFLAILSTFTALTSAQAIAPDSVDDATRSKWCVDQKQSCPLLCLQIPGESEYPRENRCNSDTLAWSCVCKGGQVPNASEYSQTVPFYECQETQNKCVDNCRGETECQRSCREDRPCGAQNPTRVNTTSIGPTSTGTATGTASGDDATATDFSGFGSAATGTGTSDAVKRFEAVAIGYGRVYGLVTVLGGVFAGFMLLM